MRHRFGSLTGRQWGRGWWRSIAVVAVLALLPAALRGQTIRGAVLEGDTTEPVVGATIDLLSADSTLLRSASSDKRGWFELELESEGKYLLRPSHPSYTAAGIDTVSVGKHEIVTVVLRMGRTAIPLEPLVVTARSRDRLSGFYSRSERGGPGHFIHRDYIESRIASRPTQLLWMVPGVRIVPNADGLSSVITLRGPAGRCAPDIFLDGLPVPQDIGMSIDDATAAALLEGVEIYDAYTISPPELPVTTNNCGIVAFWSRRDAFRPFTWKRLAIGILLGGIILLSVR